MTYKSESSEKNLEFFKCYLHLLDINKYQQIKTVP